MSGPGEDARVADAFLELLVCPVTRTPLRHDPDSRELISDAAGLAFPIRQGVAVMLVEEARVLQVPSPHGDG